MNRRDWLVAGAGAGLAIFAPRYGRWFRQGSGLLVPSTPIVPGGRVVVSGGILSMTWVITTQIVLDGDRDVQGARPWR